MDFGRRVDPAFFFANHPDPMWLFDRDSLQCMEVNDVALRWLGYTRQEFLRLTIADLRPAEDVPRLLHTLGQLNFGFLPAGTWRLTSRSGELVHADIRWSATEFDGRVAVLAAARDVTRLVKLETEREALLQRERESRQDAEAAARHFRSLFEAVPGKFLVLRADNYEIVAASDAYLAATMTRREDITGKRLFEVFPDNPDDADADGTRNLRVSLDRVRASGMADVMAVQRYPIPRPESMGGGFEERYWSPVNTPVTDGDGQPAFIIHRVEDVTHLVGDAAESRLQPQSQPTVKDQAPLSWGASDDASTPLALDLVLRLQELKAINSRLLEQEAHLRAAKRLLGLGIWQLDMSTGALTWSDNVYEIYGVPKEAFANDFDAYVALLHPDDRSAMLAGYQAFIESGDSIFTFEHRVLAADGRTVFVRGAGEFSESPRGRVLGGVVQDVTGLVEADRRLAEATRLLRLAGNVAHLGGWRVTLDPLKITWTSETAAIHGEPEGFSPTLEQAIAFYTPECREQISLAFELCAQQGEPFDEVLQLNATDGRSPWVRAIGEAVRNEHGQIVAVQGAFQDVTELVEARDRTEQLSGRLLDTLESMSDGFLTLDRQWRVVFMNTQAENLLNRPRAEVIGKVVWDEFPEAVGSIFQQQYEHAVQTGETVRFVEYFPPLEKWFEVSAHPAPDALGVYFRDITERRELDERLRQSQKLEAVGQITGGVAHDFNNLLTVILGNSDLLADQLKGQPSLRQLAELTATAAERGAELTARLLAFARRQALDPRPVDINRLIRGMDGMLRRTLTELVDIEIVQAGGLWVANVDPGQLEVALLNLAINARDAMPDGGCLTIETANTRLDGNYARAHDDVVPGQYVMVSVSDTGTGMTPSVVERAFEPFFTTKDVGKGSGLGLSMVYGFAKQSGGHIKIYTEPGEGTTVKLYLPRNTVDAPAADHGDDLLMVTGGRERILVVEDDALVREHLMSQLDELGYEVRGAGSGPEALEVLRDGERFDLLFTDVVMPGGMNGRQLADEAHKLDPAMRVLFTSGYSENAIVHHGRLDRGVQLIGKPYRRQDLALKVREVLDSSGR